MSNLSQFTLPVKDPSTGKISNQTFNLPNGGTWVGTCASAANEQHKAVTVDEGFVLKKGVRIAVKFSVSNTFAESSANRVTLNVNNTGAKQIYYGSGSARTWADSEAFGTANQYGYYIYDGTYWVWDGHNKDNNTTYSNMSVSELKTGTATTQRTVRADYLNQAITEMIEGKITGTELVVNVAANATSASFTNAAIKSTATYDVYTSVFTNLTGMSISGTTLTVNFKAVSSAMQVKLRIS